MPGLWSVPATGGNERFVLENVRETYWDVAERGVAFVVSDPALSPGGPAVRFFDFDSGRVSTLVALGKPGRVVPPGFSVARDGRSLLWTQLDRFESDLLMIDPWPPR